MKRLLLVCAGVASLAGPGFSADDPVTAPEPVALQRSMSATKQFVIYYSDATSRGRISRKLEDIKTQWLRRLGLSDEWKSPIIVRLMTVRPSNQPRITTGIYESDADELKVQIDIYDPAVLQSADFDIEVYRALCWEYAYRSAPLKAGKSVSQPPAWLLEALYEEAASEDQGLPPALYDSLLERGSPPKLEAFLKERPFVLDATSRAILRAQAKALLRSLLAQPKGAASLTAYIRQLPTIDAQDVKPLLAAFPGLKADPSLLTKSWVLSMADISATDRMRPFNLSETRKQLDTILDLSAPADPKKPDQKPLKGALAMPEIARSESGRYVLQQKAEELLRLEVRAHPLLRPAIEEYRSIAGLLAAKPRKNVESRLVKVGELASAIYGRGQEVSDYLNWFEAARLDTPSGDFSEAVDHPSEMFVIRSDAISRHLDAIEVRGW